jgi:hypothetical protein
MRNFSERDGDAALSRALLPVPVGRSLATFWNLVFLMHRCHCRSRQFTSVGMKWSGRKMMSPASGVGETVPILGASGVVRCLHLSATKHKWRLGEAGLSGTKNS